ncbi:hypothetical protein LTS07_000732 [Exophiala sideris]|uniref:C3H1-type domain-containing protein n=1 Tax=Exophiala sideris TaxID=1016849 RepID=A0ABR0JRL1_9EURO|nr:hypothetical protein LTS07_000732 [Exophiala sideris]KAK5068613.1 hypothetical protein LTR69_000733 [Exophiala sideris]KAK5186211.1 hypothetical protein LTR44_001266 [Eurotiomycetes sp. CCFEE 6388]
MSYQEPMAFGYSHRDDDFAHPNFSLVSSSTDSRRYAASESSDMSSGFYSGNDDYSLPTSSAMVYSTLSVSDNSYAVPMTSSLSGFNTDLTSQFLADDALLVHENAATNYMSSLYPGQDSYQEIMNSGYMPMEVPMYNSGTMNSHYPTDIAWPLTPPPEDYVQEVLPHHFMSAEHFQDEHCQMDQDVSSYDGNDMSRSSSCSLPRRNLIQPRPIRSASERSDYTGEHNNYPMEIRMPRDESQGDRVKARSDPLYEARPSKDGWYHCPMYKETKCIHKPTKQKCIYNKYLDSHLKPYRCKFATERGECEDARFSSNACLFRHEREAHGLHNHGLNPFMCKFRDCERSRDGNGFPRRWNQRDHMKRVHDYVEDDSPKERTTATDQPKRRKVPAVPSSAPMRRSGSSAYSKAQVMAGASVTPQYYAVNEARYNAPSMYPAQMMTCALDDVQFAPTRTVSRTSRTLPSRSKGYPG